MRSPRQLRSSEGEMKRLYDLEKWKISNFSCLITSPNCSNKEEMTL